MKVYYHATLLHLLKDYYYRIAMSYLLAKLSQCILNSTNGLVVNEVYVLQNSKCTNYVRHLIVAALWHVFHALVDEDWRDVVLLLEDFGCLGGEGSRGMGAGDVMDGCKCKCIGHILVFLRQRYIVVQSSEKT